MKKLFSFVVVAALATSFASCGGGADKAAADKAAADSTRIADSTANAAAAEAVAVPDTTAAPASTEAAAPAGH
jgi:hypothetical protein